MKKNHAKIFKNKMNILHGIYYLRTPPPMVYKSCSHHEAAYKPDVLSMMLRGLTLNPFLPLILREVVNKIVIHSTQSQNVKTSEMCANHYQTI